ncbi:PREDICTED: nuclear pore complex protein Nup155-like, partial [Priapulus caudatus]|uniref:Nuclear pore complex protein Nup155-like n=1 Tax=Priapulus caudatus TaxID=37621 RepID=A0ABM1F551_PRICU
MPVLYPSLPHGMPGSGSSGLNPSLGLGFHSMESSLEAAGMLVDKHMNVDRNYPELSDLLQTPAHDCPTVSGLNDYDYPSLGVPSPALPSLPQTNFAKKVPLPPELVEQFAHMQCNCNMGLFPEISRAWLTIDSDIFAWNYENGSDLAYFDGLNETILSVALVKPKPRIFQSHIEFLLCLATPVDIVLLGVSFAQSQEGMVGGGEQPGHAEMHLLPEPLFSIPTDNAYVTSARGTDDGRIFLTARDGCLYELFYQAEDGWFSRKCRKINHSHSRLSLFLPAFINFSFSDEDPLVQIDTDDARHILYTRSEKGTIQVFDLGRDGLGMTKVASLTQQSILYNASLIARTIDKSNFKPIVHIAALKGSESANLYLLAITHTGIPPPTTTVVLDGRSWALAEVESAALPWSYVPTEFAAWRRPDPPAVVTQHVFPPRRFVILTRQGSYLFDLLRPVDQLKQLLVRNSGPDCEAVKAFFTLHQTTVVLDGRSWALAEVESAALPWSYVPAEFAAWRRPDPPAVVTQHVFPPRRFVILTRQGSYLFDLLRPVDQLKQLLVRNSGPDCEAVKAFFTLHQEAQAAATALILACSKAAVDQQVCEWATRAFFLYGGEPRMVFPAVADGQGSQTVLQPTNLIGAGAFSSPMEGSTTFMGSPATVGRGFNPQQMSTPNVAFSTPAMRSGGFQQVAPPTVSSSSYGQQQLGPEVQFSGKHSGIHLYFCRILGAMWESRLVSDFPYQTSQGQAIYLSSSYSSEELGWYVEQLTALKLFLERNQQFSSNNATPDRGGMLPQNVHQRMLSFMQPDATVSVSAAGHMDQVQQQLQSKYQAEAQAQEKSSLMNLYRLVVRACETIGLWKILCDHQFHIVVANLSREMQSQLHTLTFKEFVIAGKEIANSLILCLISRYLGDNATTDAISSRLREVCPSLYSHNDSVCAKASEVLQMSKSTQNKQDRHGMLEESLQRYKEISTQLNLPLICSQFQEVHFFAGVVDICLTAATKRDPRGLALHYYKNGEPPDDQQGMEAFAIRSDCYACITDTLRRLLEICMQHPQAPSVPVAPGPPPAPDHNRLTPAQAEQQMEKMLQMALKSEDELFHMVLYDWLLEMELTDKLLEIKSPYVESYLKRAMSQRRERDDDDLATLDLLWKYYERNQRYMSAARILAKLADRQG